MCSSDLSEWSTAECFHLHNHGSAVDPYLSLGHHVVVRLLDVGFREGIPRPSGSHHGTMKKIAGLNGCTASDSGGVESLSHIGGLNVGWGCDVSSRSAGMTQALYSVVIHHIHLMMTICIAFPSTEAGTQVFLRSPLLARTGNFVFFRPCVPLPPGPSRGCIIIHLPLPSSLHHIPIPSSISLSLLHVTLW